MGSKISLDSLYDAKSGAMKLFKTTLRMYACGFLRHDSFDNKVLIAQPSHQPHHCYHLCLSISADQPHPHLRRVGGGAMRVCRWWSFPIWNPVFYSAKLIPFLCSFHIQSDAGRRRRVACEMNMEMYTTVTFLQQAKLHECALFCAHASWPLLPCKR